jgi:hypothetical protein
VRSHCATGYQGNLPDMYSQNAHRVCVGSSYGMIYLTVWNVRQAQIMQPLQWNGHVNKEEAP